MIDKVYNILSTLQVPVLWNLRPQIDSANKIGISYHFFSEGDTIHGDGEGLCEGGSIQIDIFSTVDYTRIVKQVKQLMKINKFRLADSRDSDGEIKNLRYYHKILIFNYIEKEVK